LLFNVANPYLARQQVQREVPNIGLTNQQLMLIQAANKHQAAHYDIDQHPGNVWLYSSEYVPKPKAVKPVKQVRG